MDHVNEIIVVFFSKGANFSFHKEKAKAIPEQGEIVRGIVCIIMWACHCVGVLFHMGVSLSVILL